MNFCRDYDNNRFDGYFCVTDEDKKQLILKQKIIKKESKELFKILNFIEKYKYEKFFNEYPNNIYKINYLINNFINEKEYIELKENYDNKISLCLKEFFDNENNNYSYDSLLKIFDNYTSIIEYIIVKKKFSLFKKNKLVNLCCMTKLLTMNDHMTISEKYSYIIDNFTIKYSNNNNDFVDFITFLIKLHSLKDFNFSWSIHINDYVYKKFIENIMKTEISLIESLNNFIKNNKHQVEPDNIIYRFIIYYSIKYYTNKNSNEKNKDLNKYSELLEHISNINFKQKIKFLKYLHENNLYLSKTQFFILLKCNKENITSNHNYKKKINGDEINNINKNINIDNNDLITNHHKLLDEKYMKKGIELKMELYNLVKFYFEKKILKKDLELAIYFINNNYFNVNKEKIYDELIIDIIKKNSKFINNELVEEIIKNKNFYCLIEILNSKYILNSININNIINNSLCIDEIFDLIFSQYLEKNRENFYKWFLKHRSYIDYIKYFNIIIDDSYLELFYDVNFYEYCTNYSFQYQSLIEKINEIANSSKLTNIKININKVNFYNEFLYKNERNKFNIDKILKKYKQFELDNICMENLLRIDVSDDEVFELIEKYNIKVKPEKMMILCNNPYNRQIYYEKYKESLF